MQRKLATLAKLKKLLALQEETARRDFAAALREHETAETRRRAIDSRIETVEDRLLELQPHHNLLCALSPHYSAELEILGGQLENAHQVERFTEGELAKEDARRRQAASELKCVSDLVRIAQNRLRKADDAASEVDVLDRLNGWNP